jgi:hypothetical protein
MNEGGVSLFGIPKNKGRLELSKDRSVELTTLAVKRGWATGNTLEMGPMTKPTN